MKKDYFSKLEAQRKIKKNIANLRADLDEIENHIDNGDKEDHFKGLLYATALFRCISQVTYVVEEILEEMSDSNKKH